jgi:hypothetical protein
VISNWKKTETLEQTKRKTKFTLPGDGRKNIFDSRRLKIPSSPSPKLYPVYFSSNSFSLELKTNSSFRGPLDKFPTFTASYRPNPKKN